MPKIYCVNNQMRLEALLLENEKAHDTDSNLSPVKLPISDSDLGLSSDEELRWKDTAITKEYAMETDQIKKFKFSKPKLNVGWDLSKTATSRLYEYIQMYDFENGRVQDKPLSLTVKDRRGNSEEPKSPKLVCSTTQLTPSPSTPRRESSPSECSSSPILDDSSNLECSPTPSKLPSILDFMPSAKLAACYTSFPVYQFHHTDPPQESPLDCHVPRKSTSPSLPPFKDVRMRRNGIKSLEKHYYTSKIEELDSLMPYDLSMRKDKLPRCVSPRSLPPYLESMKLSHCNNGGGYQCNGESPSGQQGYTDDSSYTNNSELSALAFFGATVLGLKDGSGGGGGGDGEDGEGPAESFSSIVYPNSSGISALVEPHVSSLPEHCENLNASDRSLAFPAPDNFRDNSKFVQEDLYSSQEMVADISVETHYVSQTQVPLHVDHVQAMSSLPLSPPLSCSLSPPSNGVSPTLMSVVNERHSFDSVSSQTQVPLVSSTEKQLSSNWSDKGPLSPPYNGNYISRPPSANGSIDSMNEFQDVPYQIRVNMIQQRLGLADDTSIEFVNGGHGIKNPLISQDRLNELEKQPPQVLDEDPSKFVCRVCSKVFGLQRLLNRHMKCHSDLKRYLCTFCGKGFNDTFDLKRHTRTHTGVRPYKCSLCEKSFTQRCSLESHCLKVHGVSHNYSYKERRTKMYVCEECGNTTPEPEKHYVHLKDYHPQSPALQKFYDKRSTPL